jgi:hypothetical protein
MQLRLLNSRLLSVGANLLDLLQQKTSYCPALNRLPAKSPNSLSNPPP